MDQKRMRPERHETHKQNGRGKVNLPSTGRVAYVASGWAMELDGTNTFVGFL
ncbi:hypothetical protein [Halobacillus litoralis]|uniref:hypothetical protein n=1 Tax=Halobacillus litoralis TaxID=45668 RepID=UPI002492581D|nr:hypothetical protein [Halobacillus litoralis]